MLLRSTPSSYLVLETRLFTKPRSFLSIRCISFLNDRVALSFFQANSSQRASFLLYPCPCACCSSKTTTGLFVFWSSRPKICSTLRDLPYAPRMYGQDPSHRACWRRCFAANRQSPIEKSGQGYCWLSSHFTKNIGVYLHYLWHIPSRFYRFAQALLQRKSSVFFFFFAAPSLPFFMVDDMPRLSPSSSSSSFSRS